jgi:nucleoside 2-deoxyribosyltransferase
MKFRDLVKFAMEALEKICFTPFFPNINYSSENKDMASSLKEKKKLAMDHCKAIKEADMVYFILPGGYMGTSCKIELGYALASNKLIYFSEKTNDLGLDCYPKKIIFLDNLVELKKEVKDE